MSTENLTFEVAVALGKLICPAAFESMQSSELLSVEKISKEMGIHLNSVKRWIAESVFVGDMPVKMLTTDEFSSDDGFEPIEVLAFYVCCRLGVRHQETMSQHLGGGNKDLGTRLRNESFFFWVCL